MRKILSNVWIQLFFGLIAGVIGVVASYVLATIFHIMYAGWSFWDIGSSGDGSPITFTIALTFTALIYTSPTLIWLFLHRSGSLKSADKRLKVITFILFAPLPLWIYLGWETSSRLQTANEDYRSIREGCIIKDGLNRKTAGSGITEIECKNGVYHGLTRHYNSQGIVIYEANYSNGKLDGTATSYYDDGKVSRQKNFRNGNVEGVEVFYNEDGSTSLYIVNSDQIYYQRPEKYSETYLDSYFDRDSQDFFCKNHAEYSARNYSYACVGDVIDGEFIAYDSKGNVSLRAKVRNSVLDGVYEHFTDGKLDTRLGFRNGILEGRVELYSAEGILEYEGQYTDGLQNGIFRMYDYQGNLESDVVFERGRLVRINK